MEKRRKFKANNRRESGALWVPLIAVIIGTVALLGVTTTRFSLLREHTEQERIARSAGMVFLKTYMRLGPQFHPLKRITFAFEAASGAVNVTSGGKKVPMALSNPKNKRVDFERRGSMPTVPVRATWVEPKEGPSQSSTSITAGLLLPGPVDCKNPALQPFAVDMKRPAANRTDKLQVGVLVKVEGLSSTSRFPLFGKLFGGTKQLGRNKSEVKQLGRNKSEVLMIAERRSAVETYLSQNPDVTAWLHDGKKPGIFGTGGRYSTDYGRDTTGLEIAWINHGNAFYNRAATDMSQFSDSDLAWMHYKLWGESESREWAEGITIRECK